MSDEFSDWLANRADDTPAPMLSDGTTVGEFIIVGFLGRGGSGEVYRVEHRLLKVPAALKILHRSDEIGKARFAREAEILFKHPCPGFPRFFAYGEMEGRPYLVTELLEERPLPTKNHEVAAFIRQIASAVSKLHKLGFIHRDIKPSNILWRTSQPAEPVLIDLGLVKPVASNNRPNLGTLSVEGDKAVGVGTPGYAAPEQFTGGDIDFPADIHALGVLANECFGGAPPRRWVPIINAATSSIPRRRYRSIAEFSESIAVAEANVVLFRGVLATSAIPFATSLILMCVTLLVPLMPSEFQQFWFGATPFTHAIKSCLIFIAVTSIIPIGIFKLNKWVMRFAMAEGAFFLLSLLYALLAQKGIWYNNLDTGTRFSLFFWAIPRSITFLLLLFPKIRALFNK